MVAAQGDVKLCVVVALPAVSLLADELGAAVLVVPRLPLPARPAKFDPHAQAAATGFLLLHQRKPVCHSRVDVCFAVEQMGMISTAAQTLVVNFKSGSASGAVSAAGIISAAACTILLVSHMGRAATPWLLLVIAVCLLSLTALLLFSVSAQVVGDVQVDSQGAVVDFVLNEVSQQPQHNLLL